MVGSVCGGSEQVVAAQGVDEPFNGTPFHPLRWQRTMKAQRIKARESALRAQSNCDGQGIQHRFRTPSRKTKAGQPGEDRERDGTHAAINASPTRASQLNSHRYSASALCTMQAAESAALFRIEGLAVAG
jgi:hypothetical protein